MCEYRSLIGDILPIIGNRRLGFIALEQQMLGIVVQDLVAELFKPPIIRQCVCVCARAFTCFLKHCTTVDKDVARSEGKGEMERARRDGEKGEP